MTLEIVSKMLGGLQIPEKLDLYRAMQLVSHRRDPYPTILLWTVGDNVCRQVVRAREKAEFLSKTGLRKQGGLSSTPSRKNGRHGHPRQYA